MTPNQIAGAALVVSAILFFGWHFPVWFDPVWGRNGIYDALARVGLGYDTDRLPDEGDLPLTLAHRTDLLIQARRLEHLRRGLPRLAFALPVIAAGIGLATKRADWVTSGLALTGAIVTLVGAMALQGAAAHLWFSKTVRRI